MSSVEYKVNQLARLFKNVATDNSRTMTDACEILHYNLKVDAEYSAMIVHGIRFIASLGTYIVVNENTAELFACNQKLEDVEVIQSILKRINAALTTDG